MYYKLNTKPFLNTTDNQRVNPDYLQKVLNEHFDSTAFSIFPYIHDKMNSKQCAKKGAGNCISFVMRLQDILKKSSYNKKRGIKSFIIPSTIPNSFKRDGYLPITHVALFVYVNSRYGYIIDPAFYMTAPILVDLQTDKPNQTYMRNMHTGVDDLIHYNTQQYDAPIAFHEQQYMPKNTCSVKMRFDKDEMGGMDTWEYFLREITNPDKAISNPYINIVKKTPFIIGTKMTDNGVQADCGVYLRDNNVVDIKNGYTSLYKGDLNTIPPDVLNFVRAKLGKFFTRFNIEPSEGGEIVL